MLYPKRFRGNYVDKFFDMVSMKSCLQCFKTNIKKSCCTIIISLLDVSYLVVHTNISTRESNNKRPLY